ncbi:chitin disaccharide deacetylase [Paramaledivibacter caminithermalis]|uniref:Carbohydrate deacetylase n=1 Tax=Paramaledivibacter caminithermalis (strain DSM 15212 / CIP 107654 / DViRD3) TaxID=1121301 RepID=A0A1M6T6D2_PARC5|nr:chitin disaccharide deacetylase [Paramaledivibacter caminithermalis]SHK52523.1 hypothetical protein SAMN02745912_03577 [Paramaledivibacter caminithermalis DSM 15212]
MKELIINADDFGLTKGCSKGIIKALKEGVLTNTTVMINMPEALNAIEIAKKNGIKEMGLHLTLTCGQPVSKKEKVSSLVDECGKFYKRRNQLFSKMKLEEARIELENQINAFLSTGLKLTHLDSHHHIHMYDGMREIVAAIAKKYAVSLRCPNEETKKYLLKNGIKTTDYFSMDFYGENASIENLKKIITKFPEGIIEIMTHPAYVDDDLINISSYSTDREKELEILTSDELKKWLKDKEIELISFGELRD